MKTRYPFIIFLIKSTGEQRTIPGECIYIGRSSKCGLSFHALPQHKKISRFHAVVFWRKGRWYLADLESKNGTMLNGIRLFRGQICLLHEHDIITLASTETILFLRGIVLLAG